MMLRRFGAAACAAVIGIALLPATSFATDSGYYLRMQEAEKCAADGGVYEHTHCRMPERPSDPADQSSFGFGEALTTVVITAGFCILSGLCSPAEATEDGQ